MATDAKTPWWRRVLRGPDRTVGQSREGGTKPSNSRTSTELEVRIIDLYDKRHMEISDISDDTGTPVATVYKILTRYGLWPPAKPGAVGEGLLKAVEEITVGQMRANAERALNPPPPQIITLNRRGQAVDPDDGYGDEDEDLSVREVVSRAKTRLFEDIAEDPQIKRLLIDSLKRDLVAELGGGENEKEEQDPIDAAVSQIDKVKRIAESLGMSGGNGQSEPESDLMKFGKFLTPFVVNNPYMSNAVANLVNAVAVRISGSDQTAPGQTQQSQAQQPVMGSGAEQPQIAGPDTRPEAAAGAGAVDALPTSAVEAPDPSLEQRPPPLFGVLRIDEVDRMLKDYADDPESGAEAFFTVFTARCADLPVDRKLDAAGELARFAALPALFVPLALARLKSENAGWVNTLTTMEGLGPDWVTVFRETLDDLLHSDGTDDKDEDEDGKDEPDQENVVRFGRDGETEGESDSGDSDTMEDREGSGGTFGTNGTGPINTGSIPPDPTIGATRSAMHEWRTRWVQEHPELSARDRYPASGRAWSEHLQKSAKIDQKRKKQKAQKTGTR